MTTIAPKKAAHGEKYGYFLGCVMPAKMPWGEKSTFLVAKKLGLNWDYMKETLCCVRPGVWKTLDPDTWLTLTGQNLALAEKQGITLVDSCNGCWISHYEALEEILDEPEKMEMVKKHLEKVGLEFNGSVKVKHFLQVLYEDVGIEKIKKNVVRPLTNVRLMRHIGCHARKLGNDVLPRYFDEILKATGVQLVDTPYDTMCCGLLVYFSDPRISIYRNVFKKFKYANDLAVDGIAIICSGCYDQFDRGIKVLQEEGDPTGQVAEFDIPVIHISELLALAFGYKPEEFGMDVMRTVSPTKLLGKIRSD
jgi:heterodisulfide reductase subunit B